LWGSYDYLYYTLYVCDFKTPMIPTMIILYYCIIDKYKLLSRWVHHRECFFKCKRIMHLPTSGWGKRHASVLKGCIIKNYQLTEIMFIFFDLVDSLVFISNFSDNTPKIAAVRSDALLKAIPKFFYCLSAHLSGYSHNLIPDKK